MSPAFLQHRSYEESLLYATYGAAITLWVYVIYWSIFQDTWIIRRRYTILFLAFIFLVYMLNEFGEISPDEYLDIALVGVSCLIMIVTSVYVFVNFELIFLERVVTAKTHDYVLTGLFTIAILYVSYRDFGKTFLGVLVFGIVYGLYGPLFPGLFQHGGMSLTRMAHILLLNIEGFFGFLSRITAAWIALFLLFAGMLQAYGAFDFMTRMSIGTVKYIKSGVAQSAVIASIVIGSINGSTAANKAMTGSFTIPLMKRSGLKKETAGGIEAVASTVGQGLPPVMGAGAFIMATLLSDYNYFDIIVAGLLPALILILTIGSAVHFVAVKQLGERQDELSGYKQGIADNPMDNREWILKSIVYTVPIVVLIYLLGGLQWTVTTSALYTVATIVGLGSIYTAISTDGGVTVRVRETFSRLAAGCKHGAIFLAPITIVIAAINGIIDIFLSTGVPGIFSLTVVSLSGGILIVAALLSMLVSILLGLGMPTAAAYLMMAILVAPTFVSEFGIPSLGAHFFVFYAAILAAITPPIATSVVIGSGIADSDFWLTAKEALKIGLPIFVLPLAFIYHPEIVSATITLSGVLKTLIILSGSIAIVYGLNYDASSYQIDQYKSVGLRAFYIIFGINTMLNPNLILMVGSMIFIVLILVITQRYYRINSASHSVTV